MMVITQVHGDVCHVWLSQPTRTGMSVALRLPSIAAGELLVDSEQRVQHQSGYWMVNMNNLDGATYHFCFHCGKSN